MSTLRNSRLDEGKSLSCVRLFVTLWTVAYQAPPSLGFSRQEYWSGKLQWRNRLVRGTYKNTGVGCHFLLQEIFPTQGSNLGLPRCRQTLYHLNHQGTHRLDASRY